MILMIGCLILWPGFLSWRKQRQVRLRGITVQGQVVERYQKRHGRQWYYFTCRYHYEGQTYICDQPVWRDHYERGEPLVSVCCLADNPKMAIMLDDDFQQMLWVQLIILGAIFFLVGAFILIGSPLGVFAPRHP
jgi:hypothetical protein